MILATPLGRRSQPRGVCLVTGDDDGCDISRGSDAPLGQRPFAGIPLTGRVRAPGLVDSIPTRQASPDAIQPARGTNGTNRSGLVPAGRLYLNSDKD